MSLELAPQQTPECPQDWSVALEGYLSQNGIVCGKTAPIHGGVSCYLWRLDGLKDEEASANGHREGEPAVMKCADSMAKMAPVPVAAGRMQVEIKALGSKAVAEACRQEPAVQVPRVLRKTTNGFIMSWAGETDLLSAYKDKKYSSSLDMVAIGTRLGHWLACLHLAGIDDLDHWSSLHNEDVAKYGDREEYVIRTAMGKTEYSLEQIEGVLRTMRKPGRVQTLTPWDFRPMNTLLTVKHGQEGAVIPDLTIVDWEFCHYGEPSNDLRLWVAEAIVLEAKHGERGLLSSFLKAYKGNAAAIIDGDFVCKVAVAVGTFLLLFMPAKIWDCTEEDREPWTETAIQYVKAGAERNMAWLSQSSLKPLLE